MVYGGGLMECLERHILGMSKKKPFAVLFHFRLFNGNTTKHFLGNVIMGRRTNEYNDTCK